VKPLALTRWLATLLLPPDAYAPRRILVPFAGSGSEAIGAMLAGWEHVTAVEMDADYCEIAERRAAWWRDNPDEWPEVRASAGGMWNGLGGAGDWPNSKFGARDATAHPRRNGPKQLKLTE